jgi:type VI protein secretion system component VasK
VLAVAIGAIVALREWSYHEAHRYAPGSSGDLFSIAVAVVLIGAALAVSLHRSEQRRAREAAAAQRERSDLEERLAAAEREASAFRFAVSLVLPELRELLRGPDDAPADEVPAGRLTRVS